MNGKPLAAYLRWSQSYPEAINLEPRSWNIPCFGVEKDLRSLVNPSNKSSNLVSQNAIKTEGFPAEETIGRAWTFWFKLHVWHQCFETHYGANFMHGDHPFLQLMVFQLVIPQIEYVRIFWGHGIVIVTFPRGAGESWLNWLLNQSRAYTADKSCIKLSLMLIPWAFRYIHQEASHHRQIWIP